MNYQPYRGGEHPGGPAYHSAPPPYYMPPNPYKRPIRQNGNAVGAGLVLMEIIAALVVYLLVEALVTFLSPEARVNLPDAVFELLDITVYLLVFGVPILVMIALIKIPLKVAFPLKPIRPSLGIPAVFFCLGVSYVGVILSNIISDLSQSFIGVAPTMPDMGPPTGLLAGILYFISAAVLPALLEEMMFRGVIMQSLRRFGDGYALILSSLLFSLCHGNLVQIPPTFLVGLAMGYFVLRSGSLALSVAIHFANNALAVILGYMDAFGSDLVWAVANIVFLLVYIVGAAISLIYLVFRHANMFKVAPSGYPLRESEKYILFFTSVMPIIYIIIQVVSTVRYFE